MSPFILTTSLLLAMGSFSEASPSRGPCDLDAPAISESHAKLRELSGIVEGLRPTDALADFQAAYRRVLEDPCFGDLQNVPFAFSVSSAEGVKAWWNAGAERWIRSQLELGPRPRSVVFPPNLPEAVSTSKRLVTQAMQCADGARCDAGRAWRRRTDAALNAESVACQARPSKKRCVVDRSSTSADRYRDWLWCEAARLHTRAELPIDAALQPPTEGWLTLRHVEPGGERTCARTGLYALATGDAWILDTCEGGRPLVGRVPVGPIRSLALLLAVRDDVRTSVRPEATELALPRGLQPVWEDGKIRAVIGGTYTCRMGTYLPPRHLAWRVIAGGEEAKGNVFESGECNETDNLIREWAASVQAQFSSACSSGSNPPSATWASLVESDFEKSVKEAELQDAQVIEALMRQTVARCGPTRELRNDWDDRSTVDQSLESLPTGQQRAQ